MITPIAPEPAVTTAPLGETCDAAHCWASALILVTMPSGNTLTFCGHHARENRFGLAS